MSPARLTLADVARYPRPGMTIPGRIRFTPDGAGVAYLHAEPGSLVRSLWLHDIASGQARVLAGPGGGDRPLSREEELQRERTRTRELGVPDYAFARDAERRTILIPGGPLLRVLVGDGPPIELPDTSGALDARISPDGTRVSFVRDGELWVTGVDPPGAPRRLTSGAEDGLTHGLADFIAAEELGRTDGHWWAPDNRRIAFVRADSRHIPEYPIVHQGKDEVDVERHRYPFAGAANPTVALAVIDVDTGATDWLPLGDDRPDLDDAYLARVTWRPDGVLTAQILSRDQRRLQLLAFADGATPTLLIDEPCDPWINVSDDTRFLDSGEIVRSSEATGFRHLYLHAADGALIRTLTEGDWVVTHLIGVDEQRRLAFFQATRESPRERHLYRVSLDGGEIERLTTDPGWHNAVLARDGGALVVVSSSARAAPVVTLRPLTEGAPVTLFDNDGITAESLGLQIPEFVTLPAADGITELHGQIYRPDPLEDGPHDDRRYPVVVAVYGGPHAQLVTDDWSSTVDLRAQYLAQQGYVVFRLDNRGSANRGLAFEAHLHRAMGTVEVDDQVAGVRFLDSLPYADTSRVGIYGWSYGGYMACLALMRAPDVFRVGVAGAPVTDWDGYDTGYTERYMDTPQNNPNGYRAGSVLTHVAGLRGHLLLVHGSIDENVHFRHTARLITALTAAQKPYDLCLFPEERHMPRDAAGLEYQERRLAEYFAAHL